MCFTDFNYVLIGEDKTVMCKKTDFNDNMIQEIIRKAFPELFENIPEKKMTGIHKAIRFFFPELFKSMFGQLNVPIKVESCRKMFSSKFDVQVGPLEKENEWEKNPFMALWVFVKEGITYCDAKPITI